MEDKNLEKVIVSKITQIIFFLLEIKLICSALIIWNYGQVVLSSGMWTKQEQTLGTESSKFMAVSACSICQYLWCHNQIKTIPSAIYISTMPRLHTFMPMFLSSFKTIQISHSFYSFLWGRVNCLHLYSLWSPSELEGMAFSRGEDWLCVSMCNVFRQLHPRTLSACAGKS